GLYQAIRIPIRLPPAIASPSPAAPRVIEATPFVHRSPLEASSYPPPYRAAVAPRSGQVRCASAPPIPAPAAGAANSVAQPPGFCSRCRSRRSPVRPRRSCGAARLGADRLAALQVPDVIHHLDKLSAAQQFGIGAVEPRLDDFLDMPGARRHDRDPLRKKHRLLHIVSNKDDGFARALPDAQELGLHETARLGVEGAKRLVHQQDAGVDRQRAGDRSALLHAARELRRIAVLKPGKPDQLDELTRDPQPLLARQSLFFESVEYVLHDGLPREQREMLEHDAAVGTRPVHGSPLDPDRALLD